MSFNKETYELKKLFLEIEKWTKKCNHLKCALSYLNNRSTLRRLMYEFRVLFTRAQKLTEIAWFQILESQRK